MLKNAHLKLNNVGRTLLFVSRSCSSMRGGGTWNWLKKCTPQNRLLFQITGCSLLLVSSSCSSTSLRKTRPRRQGISRWKPDSFLEIESFSFLNSPNSYIGILPIYHPTKPNLVKNQVLEEKLNLSPLDLDAKQPIFTCWHWPDH